MACLCFLSGWAQLPGAPIKKAASEVGAIPFDPAQDDSSFQVCNPDYTFQYYNTAAYYKNHKDSISRYLLQNYRLPEGDFSGQSGYVTVKFIINCKGKTGRFRVYEMDSSYQPFRFRPVISNQLLSLVKAIQSWQPASYRNTVYDSYQYICFRIRNGRILRISP